MNEPALNLAALAPEQVLETHISWVLLRGQYAYKIKKPVALAFLDFSTLEKRRHYCNAELQLNRRFAPDLYLGVVPITGTRDAPRLEGDGPAIEYALKMRRFDQSQLMSCLLQNGQMDAALVDELAATVADLHLSASLIPLATDSGSPGEQITAILDSLDMIEARWPAVAGGLADTVDLRRLRQWLENRTSEVTGQIARRRANGFVRDCHGDLHLGNLAVVNGRVTAFDGIEFDERLRTIDVICDLAFVVMDLLSHGRTDFAFRLLDGYLQRTGDYDGLAGLHLYVFYRALVRAKVALLRQGSTTGVTAGTAFVQDAQRHLRLAIEQTAPPALFLAICSGLSGSGKTRISQVLLEGCCAVRLRSDVERKRLLGLTALQRSTSGLGTDLYTQDLTTRTYDELARLAATVLAAGYPVIVDATFLRLSDRQHFRSLAARQSVPFHLIEVHADEAVLRRRVAARLAIQTDASEADIAVLEAQIRAREPVAAQEREELVSIDNSIDGDEELVRGICAPAMARLLSRQA